MERGLEILSEASRHLPAALKAAHPEIAWRQIADLGNVLRHEYHRVDDRLVWNAVQRHLPALSMVVRDALTELDP